MTSKEVVSSPPELPAVATEDAEMASGMARIVDKAIEKGDVGILERVLDMRERVMARDAREAFFRAVAAFQEECPEIDKSKTATIHTQSGGTYNYAYAPLEVVARTIRPYLKAHGLSYNWTTDDSGKPDVLNVVCVLRHVDGHEERAVFPVSTQTNAKMSAAQKAGAALTYGRRQSLIAVLGLVTADDDPDGAGDSEPITADQVRDLNLMMERLNVDLDKFLAYMGVASLDLVRAADYEKALTALRRKERGR